MDMKMSLTAITIYEHFRLIVPRLEVSNHPHVPEINTFDWHSDSGVVEAGFGFTFNARISTYGGYTRIRGEGVARVFPFKVCTEFTVDCRPTVRWSFTTAGKTPRASVHDMTVVEFNRCDIASDGLHI